MLLAVDATCHCVDSTINADPTELPHILYLRLLIRLIDAARYPIS